MSQENQSCLRFSLEESLWFRKGQEVAELVSISLDPDITIQENDQYVTIRGSLELTGEYKNIDDSYSGEEDFASAHKYVQTVEDREDGTCEFSHRFPIDITIPNNRIQSIYDIDVMVESFDYTLPERSCLKLSAELTISGLYGEPQNEPDKETQNFEVLYRNPYEIQDGQTNSAELAFAENTGEGTQLFEVEARKQPEEEKAITELPVYPSFSYEPEDGRGGDQPEVSANERKEAVQPVEPKIAEVSSKKEEEKFEIEVENIAHDEESSSSSSSDESPNKLDSIKKVIKEKITKTKSMSLTEFFARKAEGGEEKVKLKVCIVQKGDTLDRLAERYDVTMQSLLKVNHLDLNQDVYEGQVLYIPEAVARK